MKRNKLLELIGFRFIINNYIKVDKEGNVVPKEIHRVSNLTPLCGIEKMVSGKYATLWKVKRLTKYHPEAYDGCGHCNKDFHTV